LFANSPLCFEFVEWDKTFAPQVLEIGAGTGLFSVAQAAVHSEGNFLAVDVKGDRLQKGAQLAEENGLANIRFLRARADQLEEIIAPRSLDILWVTFPDPFPKKRSSGRRLTHPGFLRRYAALIKPDGALYFKTDAHALFEWSLEQLVNEGWKIELLSFDLHESDLPEWYKIETTYETRYREEGLPINFVKARPPVK
jgi:tRNA (guanine-N7-)-methyltransferase